MRVLVTGVKGQLGYDVMNELAGRGHEGIGVDIQEMDITDAASVEKVITEAAPDAVIHCAAYTAVDAAEDNVDLCRRVNAGKLLRLLLNTVVLLGLLAAVATGTLIGWAASGHAGVNCRYIVVLGAGVDGDKPSLSLQERLDAAYTYLSNHPKTICIVSGGKGSGEDLSEADCMYRELTQRGSCPDRIWKESQATTTRENLRFSIQLIQDHTGSLPTQIGLVSSEYHLYRAERIAASLGVSAVGIPAETSYLSLRVNYFLREIAAVWYYAIFGG